MSEFKNWLSVTDRLEKEVITNIVGDITNKVSDERLKEIIAEMTRINNFEPRLREMLWGRSEEDKLNMATELLVARQTIKRLVEAGRTMRNCIAGQIMAIDETGAIDGFMGMSITQEGYDVLKRIVKDYTALMQELKEEK